jgi:hypothetical protein
MTYEHTSLVGQEFHIITCLLIMFSSYIRVWNYFFMYNAYKTKPHIFIKISVEISDFVYLGPTIYIYISDYKKK